jgi:di/tricarboxylate transporter
MTSPEWRALAIICTTTLLWLTDGIHHLNPAIPALIGATALFLPVVGVLTWDDYENAAPWTIFLVTGSSLSLASSLQASGAAQWLATRAIGELPLDDLALVPLLAMLMLLVALVNVILPNRTAVLGITIPLVMSLADPLGLNPLAAGLIVPIVAQTTIFYPVQLATALVTFRTRHYSAGELFRAGLLLALVSLVTILAVALPWWALLGEPIR